MKVNEFSSFFKDAAEVVKHIWIQSEYGVLISWGPKEKMTPFTLKERKHKQSGWAGANYIFVLILTVLKTNLQQCQAVRANEGQTLTLLTYMVIPLSPYLNVAYVFPFPSQTQHFVY
jgi:hypothetical protein